jgi:ATP-dependent Clp protease ATP-binding subunit ClpB
MQQVADQALRRHFRPEFLNRLDEVVVYRRLGRPQIRGIIDKELGKLARRLARRDLELDVTSEAKDLLADLGYDPEYGARPLKRALQRYLEDELARRLIVGDFGPGARVVVARDNDRLSFAPAPADSQHAAAVA